MPYLQQVPGTLNAGYSPYINYGMSAGQDLSPLYHMLATNPGYEYNDIMGSYTESPAYQYNQQQLTAQQAGTAAAGGFTGTPYDQQQQAKTTSGLLAQDQQQYLQNILGIQGTGIQGEQGMYDTGFKASDALTQGLASNEAQEGGLAFQGAQYQNMYDQNRRNAWMNLLGQSLGVGGKLLF